MTLEVVDMETGEVVAPVSSLATLDPSEIDKAADPGAFVVLCLERSKTWLTEALDQGDIGSIVEMKSQAEAIRVYTMQKQLGKDSELAATEIVRRAERGIGVAIRRGQDRGQIETLVEARQRASAVAKGLQNGTAILKPRPQDFVDADLLHEATGLADGVTDDSFERAIAEAKSEGNLSRANVKRKVKGEPPTPTKRPEHLAKTRHHDSNRIVEQTVIALEGLCLGIDLIDYTQLDGTQIPTWSASLRSSLRTLNRLAKELHA